MARFGVRRDGLVVYRVKRTGRGRVTQRVMTPRECLARLAAMVPPPRYPLLRLHGVLAPRLGWHGARARRPAPTRIACKVHELLASEPRDLQDGSDGES